MVFALVFLVLQEGLGLFFPLLLENVGDMIYIDGTTAGGIIRAGIWIFGLVILIFIFNILSELFFAVATAGFQKKMRAEMFEKVQNAPTEKINEIGSGSVLPLFMNDCTWIRLMQKQLFTIYVFIPISVLGSVVMLFVLHPIYALFVLVLIPIFLVFFFLSSRRIAKVMQSSIPAFNAMHKEVKESITGAKEIRIFGKAKEREKSYSILAGTQRQQALQTQRAINLSSSVNAMLFVFSTIAIVVYGIHTMTDVSGILVINTAILYVKKVYDSLQNIFVLLVDTVPRVKVAKKRVMMIYGLPVENTSGGKFSMPIPADSGGEVSKLSADLEFNSVSFKHPNNKIALNSISFKVERGSRIAITGGMNSGRAIIPLLILQNVKASSGRILMNNVDISEINPTYYRRNVISFCSQEPEFIPGTIRENLKLLEPELTDKQVLDLFNEIGAQDFIRKFKKAALDSNTSQDKNGNAFLDYKIGERDTFAAPTKRLLNLVRSLLKKAPIYIFNQGFEHISPEIIEKVMEKLKREGKTCLFISQNNLVSKYCDKVYVLKNGKISGEGKHTELMRTNADYVELCSSAAGQLVSEVIIQ